MKTQYYTATSLDGFIADEGDSLEWLFALGDPEHSTYAAFIAGIGAMAMGSSTYEWLLAHLSDAVPETGSRWPHIQPTWVFSSRTLPTIDGADIRFARGDVRPVHAEMAAAAGGKNLWIAGGGDLVGQFHDAGLLDEIIVQVAATTLGGRGKPLLPRRIPQLRLVSVQEMGSGFVELRYEVPKANPSAAT